MFEDPFAGVYKKLLFTPDGTRLLGGILVGDAADYGKLLMLAKSDAPLPCKPHELLGRAASSNGAAIGLDAMPDSAQVCSCNNVSKGAICAAVRDGADTLDALKRCTKAGTGCGGCVPLVTDLLEGGTEKGRPRGRQSLVRALSALADRVVRHREGKTAADVRRDHRPLRPRSRLRNLQAGRDVDPGQPVERRHHEAGARNAAGHERPLPGEHAARRTVFRRSARAGRRDHAAKSWP